MGWFISYVGVTLCTFMYNQLKYMCYSNLLMFIFQYFQQVKKIM